MLGLLLTLLVAALFGYLAKLICERLLHTDATVGTLVGVVVFLVILLGGGLNIR